MVNVSLLCILTSYAFMFPTSSSSQLVLLMKVYTILCEVETAVLGIRKMEIKFCLRTLKINNSHMFLVDKLFLFT